MQLFFIWFSWVEILFLSKLKKNNSDIACTYEVEINPKNNDRSIFKGLHRFTIKPKDVFLYELKFLPNAEEKFEVNFFTKFNRLLARAEPLNCAKAELLMNNITEGTQVRYMLSGTGERRPPLGEIKLDTKVGQT